jgi:prepilin-type N-terminal cleavage/methylation domain-containing protein
VRSHAERGNEEFRRRAFTLIELLTVIVIIGILTGLLVAAAVPVRILVLNWRMKSEIKQMELAVERVRTDLGGGQYPPDSTNSNDFWQFFRRAFPRCSFSANNPPSGVTLPGTPAEALVFWLGGMRDSNGNFVGFSANPVNPFDTTSSTGRIGPFFDFDRTRLGPGATSGSSSFSSNPWNWAYYPQNNITTVASNSGNPITASVPPAAGSAPQPYTYFKAVGGGTAGSYYNGTSTQPSCNYATPFLDAAAMRTASASGSSAYIWINPQSFQLLCPGLDGIYGATTDSNPPAYPDGTNYGQNTLDDITNFSKGSKLESDMP